jgi:hypothetical protein
MKYMLWMVVLLTGCAGSKPVSSGPDGVYAGVLPTKNNLVFYRTTVSRRGIPSGMADSRTRAWFQTAGRALNAMEQKPIRYKTDLVYLATLPGRRFAADLANDEVFIPALRFWVTVDNRGDSTRVFTTNYEVLDKTRQYQPLEKQGYDAPPKQLWVSMWLADVDAAVSEMILSLTNRITQGN